MTSQPSGREGGRERLAYASIDPTALVGLNAVVGVGVTIEASTEISPSCHIGASCRIREGALVGPGSVLGTGVVVGRSASVGAGAVILSGDDAPPSASPRRTTVVGDHAVVEPGSVVRGGVTIGEGAIVRAGSVVSSDVPPHAMVDGNPAVIVGYRSTLATDAPGGGVGAVSALAIDKSESAIETLGCRLLRFRTESDLRGSLMVAEFVNDLPWVPARFFAVYGVPSREVRGEHAHKECEQVLVALSGSVMVILDDGRSRVATILDSPDRGLHIRSRVWGTQFNYSEGSVLGVFASHPYDPDDYIREYRAFSEYVGQR